MPTPTFSTLYSYTRLVVRAIALPVLWFIAANGFAYWGHLYGYWHDVSLVKQSLYCLVTLYFIPWCMNAMMGFMVWGYTLGRYGAIRGTVLAGTVWCWQWFTWWWFVHTSITWNYLAWYSETVYR